VPIESHPLHLIYLSSFHTVKFISSLCNEAIRKNIPVEVHVTHIGSSLLEGVRARGLPDDHEGDVR